MSKAVKKKSRRMWRTVRKTLGTLFLVSALVIAAIPVDYLAASDGSANPTSRSGVRDSANKSLVSEADDPALRNDIPKGDENSIVYTTEDKKLNFIYIPQNKSDPNSTYVSVIVGYDKGFVQGNTLDIPNTIDAYRQYTTNSGQSAGFAAVGKKGNFLFYRQRRTNSYPDRKALEDAVNNQGVVILSEVNVWKEDEDGNITNELLKIDVEEEYGNFIVCYLDSIDNWKDIDGDKLYYYYDENKPDSDGSEASLDIRNKDKFKYVEGNREYQRITGVAVNYIGNQTYSYDDQGNIIWKDVTKASEGIFAEASNITKLSLGEEFRGVGDYAFYGSGITTIDLKNGLSIIGKGAFLDCIQLQSVSLARDCLLGAIGAEAFKGCRVLSSFSLPWSVTTIGNSAFEDCERLRTVDLCSIRQGAGGEAEDTTNRLAHLGWDVFKNCASLESVTFPDAFTGESGKVFLSIFEGCNSLKFIGARNSSVSFVPDGTYYTYENFKAMLGPDTDFYFEGMENSELHKMCKEQCFAFSYINDVTQGFSKQDRYELTMVSEDGNGRNTFVVNSQNTLLKYSYQDDVKSLTIPRKIGPHRVEAVGNQVFENYCNLKTVTIPSTVHSIGAGAFQGCHNLNNVYFTGFNLEGGDNIEIDPTAFQTQNHTGTSHICKGDVVTDSDKTPSEKLNFIGPISSGFGPFKLAMSSGGKYNAPSQKESYITYYSGWPTNLKVEYDPNAINPNTNVQGMSVLTDFPSLNDLATMGEDKYPYITANQKKEAAEAADSYLKGNGSTAGMTENQIQAVEGAVNVVIPEGIQAIAPGLIREKEKDNVTFVGGENSTIPIDMTVTAFSLAAVESAEVVSRDKDGTATFKDGTGTFAGCEHLKGVILNADGSNSPVIVEDYAFEGCKALTDVSMADVASLGKAPFLGCEKLGFVNFQNSTKYACDADKSIIYGLDENGNANTVIECLPGRASNLKEVTATELGSGITTIAPEAFRGSHVRSVDLSGTNVASIPEGAFANTNELQTVTFPETLTIVGNYAFAGSGVDSFYVKGKNTGCSPFAFYGESTDAESTKRYGTVGLQQSAGDVRWYYAKDGVTSQATGAAQGFLTEETEFPTAYYVIYTYRGEDGEFTDKTLENRVASVDEAKLSYPEIPQRVTVNGMTYSFTDWEYVLEGGDTWHFTAQYDFALHVITFMDSKNGLKEVYKMEIADGGNALRRARDVEELTAIMEDPSFVTWDCEGNLEEVTGDYTAVAKYRNEGEYIVRFYVRKGSISSPYELQYTTTVKKGESAPSITIPTVTDYVFTEWDKPLNNIQEDTDFYARYAPASGGNDNPGGNTGSGNNTGDPNNPNDPNGGNNGNGNNTNNPNGGNTGSGNNTGSSNNVVRHTLQVRGGSGSGLYAAGEQIIITADEPARGQAFTSWTVSPASTVVTDKTLSSFILTMPNNDVAVIANYKASSSGTTTGSGNSSNTNSNRPNGSTGTVGGTTVVIDKNGLSNTGVVSATVNGSSDNFTIKITDSSSAAEAVLRALQAEYGSLDNIKYFPMDISLYDSTGNTRITDTTGLSVDITLPLPDSLITYAGNNKVAGVVNDRLDKLTPRFTTISGVPCITFRAEHFSPYVIYVDVTNLSDGTISDDTPTTGDGIHPKWFLSIGLACLSFVMFMMKDGKSSNSRKKQKVAVRARH